MRLVNHPDAKELYENCECCNIYTGEICPAEEILNKWGQM